MNSPFYPDLVQGYLGSTPSPVYLFFFARQTLRTALKSDGVQAGVSGIRCGCPHSLAAGHSGRINRTAIISWAAP